jgi:ElaB/YqjD/DUF883 family membrane-anchored ribosome-binding protein
MQTGTANDLADEIKDVAREAENLASATGEDWAERAQAIRQRLAELSETVQEKAVAGAKATDRAIRANPYQAMGVAFAVGFLAAVLIKRR